MTTVGTWFPEEIPIFFDFMGKIYFLFKRHCQMTEVYINSVIRVQLVRKWRRESEDA